MPHLHNEFRVFPNKVLDMHGVDLSRELETLPARFYAALQRAASAAEGMFEFLFSFKRHDFELPVANAATPPPIWLTDTVYRVCLLPSARGRVFQLSQIDKSICDSLRIRLDDFPQPFVDAHLIADSKSSGLILVTGPKGSWRTSTAVAVTRFMATQRRVHAYISERSPLYIFDEDEPYLTQILGDANARETLAALEHLAGAGRIVCVDNAVARGLAAETLMLASRGFLVLATLEEGDAMPTATALEVFCAAAGHEYNPVESTVSRVLLGVLQCDPSVRVGVARPLRWHAATHEIRRHITARDFFALNEKLNAGISVLDLIEARVANVTRLRSPA